MRQEVLRNNYLGAAVGLAVGDALGSPFEFMGRAQIEMKFGRVSEMVGGGWQKLKPGEWADDTQQFLMAVESWLTVKGFDGVDLAARLGEWHAASPNAVSTELREILREFEADPERWETLARERWYESAGVLCGNGCLSRVPVAALAHREDLPAMAEATIRLCQLTHFDPRCVDACLAINFVLSQFLSGRKELDVLEACWHFIDAGHKDPAYRKLALNYDKHTLDTHANVSPLPSYTEDHDAVPRALRHLKTLKVDDLGTSTYAVHTMQTALWIAFHAESFEEGTALAASLGGEADTQAAIAGLLLGARHGYNEIPPAWLKILKDRARIVSLTELLMEA